MSILKVYDRANSVWVEIPISTLDASIMGYSPADLTDWNSSDDPGNVDDALDQLASRVTPIDDDAMLAPIGLSIANLTDLAVNTRGNAYFLFLGRAMRAITTSTFLARVTTSFVAGGSAYAEIGVFTGEIVANGNASLSRVGLTDVSAIFNSTGTKAVTIALSGVSIGDALWLAWGVGGLGGTVFQLRAMLADDIQSGVFQSLIGRISTMAVPATTTLESATTKPAWARLAI